MYISFFALTFSIVGRPFRLRDNKCGECLAMVFFFACIWFALRCSFVFYFIQTHASWSFAFVGLIRKDSESSRHCLKQGIYIGMMCVLIHATFTVSLLNTGECGGLKPMPIDCYMLIASYIYLSHMPSQGEDAAQNNISCRANTTGDSKTRKGTAHHNRMCAIQFCLLCFSPFQYHSGAAPMHLNYTHSTVVYYEVAHIPYQCKYYTSCTFYQNECWCGWRRGRKVYHGMGTT